MRAGLIVATLYAAIVAPAKAQVVTLTPTPDGVVAEYCLETAAARFDFADKGVVRSDWVSRTEGLALDDATVSGSAPVSGFSLLIRPDSTEDGRGYIALVRVGEGYVIYAPALAGEGQLPALTPRGPADWILTPTDDARGYVYFGPQASLRTLPSGATAIADPGLAASLRDAVFDAFDQAVGFYTERFGPPPRLPMLSATTQGAGPMTFRGDVTDTPIISARFHGAGWADPRPDDLNDVAPFAFHETAHIWNSHFAVPVEGSPWLHEGGAEYMAVVGAATLGRMTEDQARESLSNRLTGCRRALGSRAPITERLASGSAVYDCGVLIQWLADMELRREPGAPNSIFDIWKGLIDHAAAARPEYGPADFRAGLAPDSAVTLLLDGPGEGRWPAMEERLTRLGVRWVNRPSRQDYVAAVFFHLIGQACTAGSSTGFYFREGYIQLGNADTCGPLSGDAPLATVEGLNPLEQPQAMFEAVQARCALNEPVRFVRRDTGAESTTVCAKPLNVPTAYAIADAPALALPLGSTP